MIDGGGKLPKRTFRYGGGDFWATIWGREFATVNTTEALSIIVKQNIDALCLGIITKRLE